MSNQVDQQNERGVWVTQAHMRLTGSPDCALFLAQCVYWSKCTTVEKRSGWFYKTRDEWKVETCLSRYKQEKARKRLKDLGVLQERHERLNDGIRLWYRINLGLLNKLLNVSLKNDMNVLSEKTGVDVCEDLSTDATTTESSSIDVLEDIKLESPYSGKSGTKVQESKPEVTAYSLSPENYVFCHVFIYQFVKYGVPKFDPVRKLLFQVYGFDNHDVFDAFCDFVATYQDALRHWYQSEASIEVLNITADDIVFAQISGAIYESA